MATDVVVIFALDREAAPFRRLARRDRLPVRIAVGGIGAAAAARVSDARLVISAGFCGALNPALRVGDVVTDRLLTVPHVVATPAEKRDLRARTGADVVDMEASHIAAACAARGIPFLAVKAVSDTADTALSPRLVKLLAGGRVSPAKAAGAVFVRPRILLEFRRLARDTRLAAKNLAERLREICLAPPSPG